MKKVLCGLVIALMMTGSGYAYEGKLWKLLPEKKEAYCSHLYKNAAASVHLEYLYFQKRNEITDPYLQKTNEIGKPLENIPLTEDEIEEIDEISAKKLEQIKLAHYYAVTWSALCD